MFILSIVTYGTKKLSKIHIFLKLDDYIIAIFIRSFCFSLFISSEVLISIDNFLLSVLQAVVLHCKMTVVALISYQSIRAFEKRI